MLPMNRMFATIALLGIALADANAAGDEAAMKRLSLERGCSTCHSDKEVRPSASSTLASAPSWPEIAKRYRGRRDAEDLLTRLVVTGSDPGTRHWSGKAAFVSMLPNDVQVTPDEARSLVRWILAWPQ